VRAYWNSQYRPIECHVLSFRELRLVVDYLEGSLSMATRDDTAWIGGTASGTSYISVVCSVCHFVNMHTPAALQGTFQVLYLLHKALHLGRRHTTFCCSKQLNHTFLLSSLTWPWIFQNLDQFLLFTDTSMVKLSRRSDQQFLCEVTNRQAGKQTHAAQNNLLGESNTNNHTISSSSNIYSERYLDCIVSQTADNFLVVVLQAVYAFARFAPTDNPLYAMTTSPPVVLNKLQQDKNALIAYFLYSVTSTRHITYSSTVVLFYINENKTCRFLLLHSEHGTGYRRSWNWCDRWTRFVVTWKHFCFILSTGTRYGLTLWYAPGLLVGRAIQVPQLQLQLTKSQDFSTVIKTVTKTPLKINQNKNRSSESKTNRQWELWSSRT